MIFERFFKKLKRAKKAEKPLPKKTLEPEKPKEQSAVSKMRVFDGSAILFSPHVTEKATLLSKDNQYVFKVFPAANKIEIRKAVESLYKVKVIGVRIIKVGAKKRRLGKVQGWKKGYKKAIIQVKPGQKIEAATV
ncbi:MAG: 50S ribosomal protein L23 [bacterium]|nr:50S ribosomal protein L23 [bacterium]